MPVLKQISCAVQNVQSSGQGVPLQEHATRYADGYVETYIAIPSNPTPFSIRLRSHGYIAPGLAMFVYMDGVYQCNRNRTNLKTPGGTTKRAQIEVDFHVRQKEEMMPDGTFNGKPWKFGMLNTVSGLGAFPYLGAPHPAEDVGTIEVLVLRCLAPEVSEGPRSNYLKALKNSEKPKYTKEPEPEPEPEPKLEPESSEEEDEDENSSISDGSVTGFGGMFDGAYDPLPKRGGRDRSSRNKSISGSGLCSGKGVPQWGSRDHSKYQHSIDWANTGSSEGNRYHSPSISHVAECNGFNGNRERISAPSGETYSTGSAVDGANEPAASGPPAVVININRVSPPSSLNNGRPRRRDPDIGPPPRRDSGSGPPPRRDPNLVSYDDDQASDVDSWGSPKVVASNGNNDQTRQSFHGSTRHTYPDASTTSAAESWKTAPQSMPGGWQTPDSQFKGDSGHDDNDGSSSDADSEDSNQPEQNNGNVWGSDGHNNNTWGTDGNKDNSSGKGTANSRRNNNANSNYRGRGKKNERKGKKDKGSAQAWNSQAPGHSQNQGQKQSWNSNGNNNAQQGGWGADSANTNTAPGNWGGDNSANTNATAPGNWGGDNTANTNAAAQGDWGGDNTANNNATTPGNWGSDNTANTNAAAPGNWGGDNKENTNAAAPGNWGGDNKQNTNANNPGNWGGDNSANTNNNNINKPDNWGGNDSGDSQQSDNSQGSAQDQDQAFGGAVDNSSWAQPSQPNADNSAAAPGFGAQSSSPIQDLTSDTNEAPASGHGNLPNDYSAFAGPRVPLSATPKPKAYWSSWRQSNEAKRKMIPSDPADEPAEPLYRVPLEIAQQKNTSHQVHVVHSAPYSHKKSAPMYMDSFENPYAVFVFHYRSKQILETMLEQSLDEPESEEKRRLSELSKEELIEHLLKAKASAAPQGAFGGTASSDVRKSDGFDPIFKVNQNLSDLQIKDRDSDCVSFTDPEYHLGRTSPTQGSSPPIWNTSSPSNHQEYVADWEGRGSTTTAKNGGGQSKGSSQSTANTLPAVKYVVPKETGPVWTGKVNWDGEAGVKAPATVFWAGGSNTGDKSSNTTKQPGSW